MEQPKIYSAIDAHRKASEERNRAQKEDLKFQSMDATRKLSERMDTIEANLTKLDLAVGKLVAFLADCREKDYIVPKTEPIQLKKKDEKEA